VPPYGTTNRVITGLCLLFVGLAGRIPAEAVRAHSVKAHSVKAHSVKAQSIKAQSVKAQSTARAKDSAQGPDDVVRSQGRPEVASLVRPVAERAESAGRPGPCCAVMLSWLLT
jgi:hypothetical protein